MVEIELNDVSAMPLPPLPVSWRHSQSSRRFQQLDDANDASVAPLTALAPRAQRPQSYVEQPGTSSTWTSPVHELHGRL